MSAKVEVLPAESYVRDGADLLAGIVTGCRSVVVTGGRTAAALYPALADEPLDWDEIEVYFSDERCVPPHHEASNFRMASELLLDRVRPRAIHRMRGEDEPDVAAALYDEAVGRVQGGFDVVLLGLGGDCHIAALFPGSPGIDDRDHSCIAVARPDGMAGLSLTPRVLGAAKRIVVITSGSDKAAPLARAVAANEPPSDCPAALLADHPSVTFVVDDQAAELL